MGVGHQQSQRDAGTEPATDTHAAPPEHVVDYHLRAVRSAWCRPFGDVGRLTTSVAITIRVRAICIIRHKRSMSRPSGRRFVVQNHRQRRLGLRRSFATVTSSRTWPIVAATNRPRAAADDQARAALS